MTGLSLNENAVTLKTDTDFTDTEIRIVEDGASQRMEILGKLCTYPLFKSFFTGPDAPNPNNTTGTGAGTPRLFLKTYQDWIQGSNHVSEALNMVSLTRTAKSVQSWKLDPSLYAGMAVNPFDAGVPDPLGDSLVAQVFHELLVDTENAIEFFVPFSAFTTYNGQTYGTASSSGRANNTVYKLNHGLTNGTRVWLATRFNDGANDFVQGVETQHNKSYYAKVLDANTFELYRDAGLTDLIIIGQNTSTKNASFGILVTTNQNHGHFSFAEIADHTRQLHTKFAVDYWTRWVMLKMTESLLVLSGAGVDQWLVADEAVGKYIQFGERVYAPQFRIGRNSAYNFDLDFMDDNYVATTALRLFRSSGTFQVGGGTTDLNAKLAVRQTSSSIPVVNNTTVIGGINVEVKRFQSRLATTTTGTTAIKALPAITDPSVQSVVGYITVKDSTVTTLKGAFLCFKALMQRSNGSTTLIGTPSITLLQGNITGFTASNVTITVSAGVLSVNAVGIASTTMEWQISELNVSNF